MDHDQNFKNFILDYPREALQFFAHEESEGIGPQARITPLLNPPSGALLPGFGTAI